MIERMENITYKEITLINIQVRTFSTDFNEEYPSVIWQYLHNELFKNISFSMKKHTKHSPSVV